MQSSVRILCVDDDPVLLSAITELLTLRGYEVTAVSTGRAAVAHIGEEYDLVMLDYDLPDWNGDVVAEHWKREHPAVPILLLSACVDLPQHALDHVDAYLRKGAVLERLFSTVSKLTHQFTHAAARAFAASPSKAAV